ncbi:MAG: peptidylprolyl isomerase [Gammaproteobacteria bacterium]|nr:peptidylprolyl isomerase [Gammaproteobacteria bacterium]
MEMTTGAGTPLGTVDVELYDDRAPITVRNFLKYAGIGYYDKIIIHRSIPGFVIQGGGYMNAMTLFGPTYVAPSLGKFPPIQNEFSSSRSNIRGTITMAKLPGNPDSATSEWFFNLADNSANLDNQNGGFTVFGHVLDNGPGTGMDVVDAIADLKVCKIVVNIFNVVTDPACSIYNSAFTDLPVDNFDSAVGLQPSNLILVHRIPNVRSARPDLGTIPTYTTDVDMVFDFVGTAKKDYALKLLESFSSPQNQSVHFNNGIHTMTMSGVMGSAGRIVTVYDDAAIRPTRYYAYGKTPDNPTDHWYDFSYDGETGAEISGDKIILHFVDGKRGDEDLDPTNNSITHTGAQAVVTSTSSTDVQSGGCSITATPSPDMRGGDWIAVSLFLAFVAFVRRRTRRQRI